MALPKKNRMTGKDFTKLFRSGKRIRGQFCSVQYGPLKTDEPKIAVVVQTKAVPSAVGRNRIRRILFDEMGRVLSKLSSNVFLVVIVHTKPSDSEATECREELIGMLEKSGIIN